MMSSISKIIKELKILNNADISGVFQDNDTKYSISDLTKYLPENHLNKLLGSQHKWTTALRLNDLLSRCKAILMNESLISVPESLVLKQSCRKLMNIAVLPLLKFSVPQWPKISCSYCLNDCSKEKDLVVLLTMKVIIDVLKLDVFCDIMKNDLGPILGGLFHIYYYVGLPLKERDEIKAVLFDFLDKSFQPDVMRELMVLQCSKGDNGKVSRIVRQILLKKMMVKDGLICLITAVITEGATVTDMEKLALLISHKHPIEGYFEAILPQVLILLDHKKSEFKQVGSLCIVYMFEKYPDVCKLKIVSQLLKPLQSPSGENEIENCLNSLENFFSCNKCGKAPWFIGHEVIQPLFISYCCIRNSVCHLKLKIKSLLLQCLDQVPDSEVNSTFFYCFFPPCSKITYCLGDNGGMISKEDKWSPFIDETVLALLEILSNSYKLKFKLFTSLLECYNSLEIEKKLIVSNALSNLSTEPDILKSLSNDPLPIISFLQSLFVDKNSDNESLVLGLVILSIIVNDRLMNKERNWKLFDPLVEPLKKLKQESSEAELRVLADDLITTLFTKGIVGSSVTLPTNLNEVRISEGKPEFEKAMEEVSDVSLPVRAHGIRTLGQLILNKDKTALKNRNIILALFKENLKHEDSFMYLSCVQALSSLASEFPDEILNTLCDHFCHSKSSDMKLKIGEILLNVTKKLGEMVAVYKRELINTFLAGCSDDDNLVRASSLSNLGELCKILSFRISAHIMEIFNCILSMFDGHSDFETRRAAVMVAALIIKGFGSDIFSLLEPILLDLYRKLKLIYQTDPDDVTRLHAQIALEELNVHTVSFMCPEQKLCKRISLL